MKHFLPVLLALCFFSACTPLRVVRVTPQTENDVARYDYGAAVLESTTGPATVAMSFYDATSEFLVFNVAITNTSEEAFDFDPASITMVTNLEAFAPAIDPELYLLDHDMSFLRQQRKARVWGWVGAAALVGAAVIGAEAAGQNIGDAAFVTETVATTAVDLSYLAAAPSRLSEIPIPPDRIPPPEYRSFWLDHALRLTTIAPGQTAMGKVVFPRDDEAVAMTLSVPFDAYKAQFKFRQLSFRPDSVTPTDEVKPKR